MLDGDIQEIAADVPDAEMKLAAKTILLAGAHGFLGRYLLAVLRWLNGTTLSRPCRVLAVDSGITAADSDRPGAPWYAFRPFDVTQRLQAFDRIDYVIHAAGIASPYYYRKHPLETLDVSVNGTRHLLDVARRDGARLLFFSSSEIYGTPDQVPTPEDYVGRVPPRGSRSVYDVGKLVGETLCHTYSSVFGTDTVTVRPHNVYGPGMRERDYRVLSAFASAIKGRRPLRVFAGGEHTRTYCYVSDAMRAIFRALLLGEPGGVYNIGAAEPEVSVHQLVDALSLVVGRPLDTEAVPAPADYPHEQPRRRCPDLARIGALGYVPRVSLRDGLARFLAWTDHVYEGAA